MVGMWRGNGWMDSMGFSPNDSLNVRNSNLTPEVFHSPILTGVAVMFLARQRGYYFTLMVC
jgi:hypothetical protein